MTKPTCGWQPIETAPENDFFLAERQTTGDWLKVMRWKAPGPHDSGRSVIHPPSGLLWPAERWMPLPAPPETTP
jgi:hypothetical protein